MMHGVRGVFTLRRYSGSMREPRGVIGGGERHVTAFVVQAAAVVAFDDQSHVHSQREVYLERLTIGLNLMRAVGATVEMPGGGFYLWAQAPDGDSWALARTLAECSGVIVSPGEFYGDRTDYVRFAAVQPTADLQLALERTQS